MAPPDEISNSKEMAMAKAKQELNWVEIDVETLDGDAQLAYAEYKTAYRMMKEARKVFEDFMQSEAPEGKALVFGYNFGKLSVAVTEKAEAKAKPQPKQSLSQYLAGMQANGRRT